MSSDQFFFFCHDATSTELFPSNKPWDFRVDFTHQQERLRHGRWTISACYIRVRCDNSIAQFQTDRRTELHIICNACDWSYINCIPLKYLRSFLLYSRDVDEELHQIQCVPVHLSNLTNSVLHLQIENNSLELCEYLKSFVVLLLFKRET